jgi:hypothetical protein
MANQSPPAVPDFGRSSTAGLLVACFLIAHFMWNCLVPAHEYPVRAEQVLTMTLDFLMVVGLFSFRRAMPAPLFGIALLAGIGLFALRLSKAGWWTGHLVYTLLPR